MSQFFHVLGGGPVCNPWLQTIDPLPHLNHGTIDVFALFTEPLSDHGQQGLFSNFKSDSNHISEKFPKISNPDEHFESVHQLNF